MLTAEEYQEWMKKPITWEAAYVTARSNVEGTLLQMLEETNKAGYGNPQGDLNIILTRYISMICHRMDELGDKAALSNKSKIIVPKPGLRLLR